MLYFTAEKRIHITGKKQNKTKQKTTTTTTTKKKYRPV